MTQFNDSFTPKKIGNFNIPKNVIECKIDTLALLELLLRKNVATWEEIDEIREAVVMHMNVMYPELQLTYSTPQPMKDEAPIGPPETPKQPLFYTAPPPEMAGSLKPEVKDDKAKQSIPVSPPMYQNVQPPKINSMPRSGQLPVKPVSQQAPAQVTPNPTNPNPEAAQTNTANAANPPAGGEQSAAGPTPITPGPNAPKPMFPNAGPPKILSNPPRNKI